MTKSINRQDTFVAIGSLLIASSGGDTGFSDADIDFDALKPNHLPPRGFAVFTAGNVKVMFADGSIDTYLDGELIRGLIYPWAIRRVYSTGTTVTKCRIYW